MKQKRSIVLGLIAGMLLLVIACSFSTANISEAFLAREVNDVLEKTTTFGQDEVINCAVILKNAPDGTVTKASWYAVDAEGLDPNSLILESEYDKILPVIVFTLSFEDLSPVGTYRVDLSINDKIKETLEFEIQ